jgi:hypothetical protein
MIVHHSAGALTQTPLEIDVEHRAEGWAEIGYNFVITPDGAVYTGRPLDVEPSAAYGDNMASVDICLIGNFQEDDSGHTGPPTSAQLDSLLALSIDLHRRYPSISRTIGHGDVVKMYYPDNPGPYATACPGTQLEAFLPDLRSKTAAALG